MRAHDDGAFVSIVDQRAALHCHRQSRAGGVVAAVYALSRREISSFGRAKSSRLG